MIKCGICGKWHIATLSAVQCCNDKDDDDEYAVSI